MKPDGMLLVTRAADFAARRHVEQRRKGAAREPYVNHLAEVAGLLAEATDGKDAALIAAGFLHDTLEDTATEYEELAAVFGSDVAALVAEVTDDKSLPKAERKRLQIVNAAKKTERARLLKIADKTSNLRALAVSPPADWELDRASEYIDWAEQVVSHCRGLNAFLDKVYDAAAVDARTAITERGRGGRDR
jgi:guanosine-3',5'-bis(diphosphate) 3'-pyrophosphohydrolase